VKYSVVKEIERERQMLELDVQRLTWLILHGQRKLGPLWKEMSDEEIDQEMRGE
jgi:hypothetical protein